LKVTLTRITKDPILAIEEAASNCYNSEATGDGKIMKHCIKSGHTSVTEFCDFTFHIEGVSRALSHQLVRHRMASYAQRSQRYCSENGFGYVKPKTIKADSPAEVIYNNAMDYLSNTYKLLQELDIPNEDARMVLPNACETQIEVKMNLRAIMNFMNERLCSCAQWEIRELAMKMRNAIIEKVPELAEYLVPKCEKYGKEFGFCNESKSRTCGRHPRLEEIFEVYHNYNDMCNS
jgi:thymidylate synthase (FAD)